jgi:hypothetical protein
MDAPSPAEPARAGGNVGRTPSRSAHAASYSAAPSPPAPTPAAPTPAAPTPAARVMAYSVAEAALAPLSALLWGAALRESPAWTSPSTAAAREGLAFPVRRVSAARVLGTGRDAVAGTTRGAAGAAWAGRSWEARFDAWHRAFAAVEGC